jgi:hypothetical protein
MTRYIDAHRDRFGVEPICQTLQNGHHFLNTRQPTIGHSEPG